MRAITITDVAKHANVSKSTVSQYLNKRYEYMSENTRKKIEATIRELNYQPNIIARSLKQKSTFTVGVVVANILHTFSTQVTRAIENYFYEHGFHIIVCNADDDPEKEKNYIEMLRAKQVDGIIIFPTGDNLDLYQRMKRDQFPIVFMDRTIEDLNIATVMLDNHLAAKLAIDEFVARGYQDIAIITTSISRNISPRVERIQGYKAALQSHGLPVRPHYIKTADVAEIPHAMSEMLGLQQPPHAILAGNDIVLNEVLRYIKTRDLRIPHDVAVVGIDDVPFANFYTPEITTVKQPAIEMASQAAELLLNQINSTGEADTSVHRFQPTLLLRNSC
ncbi:substrate-binding domain-containing protein [Paenibacillus xerothermodurans]|uniref:LacI family transcriptional regulator n=1 Tax=Paenibacillus xerothermodurans TaxID=1977292 RepID=A0A2W1NQI8_PAEXE|nr:substrate-binding domain-containing protein [Paenibacillus xerothermodurans]PZE21123.1 LacI family transcriptional regulator [Paenibacillus xerothermodurans]